MPRLQRTGAAIRLIPALLLTLLLLPASVHAQETQDTTKLDAKLRGARGELHTAVMALDAARATSQYMDDAVVEFGDQVFNGKAAVQAWLTDALAGLSAVRFGTPSFTIAADQVVEGNTYSIVLPDGSQQQGTTTLTWRKQGDGSWKVSRHVVG